MLYMLPQDVSGRDMGNIELNRDPFRLGSLAGTGWPEEYDWTCWLDPVPTDDS
jgi:hypothetical protein